MATFYGLKPSSTHNRSATEIIRFFFLPFLWPHSLLWLFPFVSNFLPNSSCFPGEITTTALLDRELKSEYILIVRAVDGGVGPQQKTGIATVTTRQPVLFFLGALFYLFHLCFFYFIFCSVYQQMVN